ncbi:MAG: hypothetical protein ACXQS6_06990 [Candidatus Syntropharchaeales archaeon]|nr:hypothetical protein [Candidatus Syntrophoarchaeum sp.]
MQVKQLSEEEVKEVQALEKDLGVVLVAYTRYADLDADATKKVQALEEKLGLTLLAFE